MATITTSIERLPIETGVFLLKSKTIPMVRIRITTRSKLKDWIDIALN